MISQARKVGAERTRDPIRKDGGVVVSLVAMHARSARQGLVTNYARAVVELSFAAATRARSAREEVVTKYARTVV